MDLEFDSEQRWLVDQALGSELPPLWTRVFNPTAQAERWDPDGEYQRRWIPELNSDRYPAPMVDHGEERKEALRRYEAARARLQSISLSARCSTTVRPRFSALSYMST